jgi:hypothetical protein
MQAIDEERCLRAMADLTVEGKPSTKGERGKAIMDAIAAIQADGAALRSCYIGVKNYAGFGDQREDHTYGMGPRHGSIVFSVRRCHKNGTDPPELTADHVYLLECVRDCEGRDEPRGALHNQYITHLNLCDLLRERETVLSRLAELNESIGTSRVDSHEIPQSTAAS